MRRRSFPNFIGDYAKLVERQAILERIMQVMGFTPDQPYTLNVNDGTRNRVMIGKINGDYGIKIVNNAGATIVFADGHITADGITTGTLDASIVNVTNLNASNIVTGTISANIISGGTINANDVNITNLHANNITVGQFTDIDSLIADGSLPGKNLANSSVNGGKIIAHTIAANRLIAHSLTANEMTLGSAIITQSAQIANAVITNAHISALSANKITTGSLVVGVSAGSRTGGKIGNWNVSASDMYHGYVYLYGSGEGRIEAGGDSNRVGICGTDTGEGDSICFWAGGLYANRATAKVRIKRNGQFYFGGNASNYVEWNGSTLTIRGSLSATNITAGTLNVDRIAAGTIVASKIGLSAVTNTKLKDWAVSSHKIADYNVTSYKIQDSVTLTGTVALNNTVAQGYLELGTWQSIPPYVLRIGGGNHIGWVGGEGSILNTDRVAGYNDLRFGIGSTTDKFWFMNISDVPKMTVDNWGNIYSDGGADLDWVNVRGWLTVHGAKSFKIDHPEDPEKDLQYASVESPEVALMIRGNKYLMSGSRVIQLPRHWELVTEEGLNTVLVTPHGDCKGLYVTSFNKDSFEIRECQGGTSDISFSWQAMAVRKGFGDYEVEPTKDSLIKKKAERAVLNEEFMESQEKAKTLEVSPKGGYTVKQWEEMKKFRKHLEKTKQKKDPKFKLIDHKKIKLGDRINISDNERDVQWLKEQKLGLKKVKS